MKPKMIWANLAVADLDRTQKFYTGLGFKPNNPNSSKELVSFFFGENNFVIHFFLKEILETNVKIVSKPESFGNNYYGFVFADPDGHKFNVFYM